MATPTHRAAPGSSYFVTTKCWEGRSAFQVTEIAEILLSTLLHYRDSGAYLLHEFVIMPDHLHLMLTPGLQTSLEKAVQLIKGGSSHRIHKVRGGKMEIWQVGFHDWTIRDLEDWKAKANYIQMNPVKARLCERPEDWAYSSACSKFALDGVPVRYQNLASGAKAQDVGAPTPGLKPRPPKEAERVDDTTGCFTKRSIVGHEGPTPKSSKLTVGPFEAQHKLKPLPPKQSRIRGGV
jgi:putative transposase